MYLGWSWFGGGPGQTQDESIWESIMQSAVNEAVEFDAGFYCPADVTIECLDDYIPQNNTLTSNAVMPNSPIGFPTSQSVQIPLSITSSTKDAIIRDVNVVVHITHNELSDLQITLSHPLGSTITLFDHECNEGRDINVIFDDGGFNLNCQLGQPALSGNILSVDDLSVFKGLKAEGDWILEISDVANGVTGVVRKFGLDILEMPELGFPQFNDSCLLTSLAYSDIIQLDNCQTGTLQRKMDLRSKWGTGQLYTKYCYSTGRCTDNKLSTQSHFGLHGIANKL